MRREFSAGGVVVRAAGAGPEVAVIRPQGKPDGHWVLPKGALDPGESSQQAALREVREETGLRVRITGPLDSIEYWFVQSGTRIHKTVHYFLMEPVGGDLAAHDHEFDEVRWISFESAGSMLTFETERALVARAGEVLARRQVPDGTAPATSDRAEATQ
jgi:8-oxo-dGTP pyrophosphatase MutT (NUDIX family)